MSEQDIDFDQALEIGVRILSGEAPEVVIHEIMGDQLRRDPPRVVVSAEIRGRERDFLAALDLAAGGLSRWLAHHVAELRRMGLERVRDARASKEPGDGLGPVLVPLDQAGGLRA